MNAEEIKKDKESREHAIAEMRRIQEETLAKMRFEERVASLEKLQQGYATSLHKTTVQLKNIEIRLKKIENGLKAIRPYIATII